MPALPCAELDHPAAVLHAPGASQCRAQRAGLDAPQVSRSKAAAIASYLLRVAAALWQPSPKPLPDTCLPARLPTFRPPSSLNRCTACSGLEPNVFSYTALLAMPRNASDATMPQLLDQVGGVAAGGQVGVARAAVSEPLPAIAHSSFCPGCCRRLCSHRRRQ